MRFVILNLIIININLYFSSPLIASDNYMNVYPGSIYIKELTRDEYQQDIYLNNDRLLRWNKNNKFFLVYGISYNTKLGVNKFVLKDKNSNVIKNININILKKDFNTQKINVDKKYVKPNKDNIERIKNDSTKLSKARKIWVDINPDLDFVLPVKGITTGVFGTKRFYNGIEGNYHNGHDIAADIGTPILAPSSGKIILTGDFFYNGKTIYLDHGRGLKSIMIHLDEILVQDNDFVKKGEIIGKVGTTGKSTGPHLHWSVLLNNTYIDPDLLIDKKVINNLNLEGS
tara:strand:+ start:480 stop:1337 length:858 start_codon:yes stop_codon:yes gene_type:complete